MVKLHRRNASGSDESRITNKSAVSRLSTKITSKVKQVVHKFEKLGKKHKTEHQLAKPASILAHPKSSLAQPVSNLTQTTSTLAQPASKVKQVIHKLENLGKKHKTEHQLTKPASFCAQPASKLAQPASILIQHASDTAQLASGFARPASILAHAASILAQPASGLAQPASGLAHAASILAHAASILAQPAAGLTQPAFILAHTTEGPFTPLRANLSIKVGILARDASAETQVNSSDIHRNTADINLSITATIQANTTSSPALALPHDDNDEPLDLYTPTLSPQQGKPPLGKPRHQRRHQAPPPRTTVDTSLPPPRFGLELPKPDEEWWQYLSPTPSATLGSPWVPPRPASAETVSIYGDKEPSVASSPHAFSRAPSSYRSAESSPRPYFAPSMTPPPSSAGEDIAGSTSTGPDPGAGLVLQQPKPISCRMVLQMRKLAAYGF
ncbi:MAG: hypothetical protein FRX48_08534 [Lasallia pustulata]|uniref:Uncharacterized protein n=1 Tax=Lasallia pustulata TaxID=136370 RepID=A0A5M8PFJ4_9LECA|nr:MAG: hypothetical protein FRX48_08534 [Lasallia pustulata]